MMAGPIYLGDTSVFVYQARDAAVGRRFEGLLANGRLAACQMTALEYLNNAPNPQAYELVWDGFQGMRWVDVTSDVMNRALAVHRRLGEKSQHRHFRLPDLIIAATAELNGATVLHYDADYDRIAEITGQSTEWVAPKGSL
jgi:predicted nucleic acid-binding protein